MKRAKPETVGKLSVDLLSQADNKHTVSEQMHEQLNDYDKELYDCFYTQKSRYTGIFYIVVLTRGDRLLTNVVRHMFFARHSCPTPDYDQCVYQCHKDWPEPKFMWVIPCKDYCEYLRDLITVPEEHASLYPYVRDFYDGTLLALCKKLNHETEDTGQLILGESRGK
jgi:hypothetical protein